VVGVAVVTICASKNKQMKLKEYSDTNVAVNQLIYASCSFLVELKIKDLQMNASSSGTSTAL
jgi:hypothetical protein